MRGTSRTPALVSVAAITVAGFALVGSSTAEAASPPSTPYTWGDNAFGQLGNGTTTDRLSAGAVNILTDVIDIHGGREHVAALRADGTVWTWGSNQEGQLGLGTTANRSTPAQVPGLSNIVAVETGHNFSMALRDDGTVWEWGLNTDGQLGDGSLTNRRSPVQVTGLTDAVAIAGGRNMSYAIRESGQVWAWGRNDEGQLGDGTSTRRTSPVRVGTLTGIVRIAGGRDHGLAVNSAGAVWSWGSNDYGQLGDGSLTDRRSPVPVSTTAGQLTGIADVAAGAHHSFALRATGTVASWGRNYRANLGDGTGTQRTRPVSVLDVAGATSIGSMRDGGVVTLGDGRVKTWGDNASGQLGDGTTTNRNRAVFVPGVNNAVKAGGGGAGYAVVLQSFGPLPDADPVARISGSCTGLSCPLSGATSSDSDGFITGYAWDFGDGTQASGVNPGHTYAAAGTYTVTLTVTDDDNDTGTATLEVTVAPVPNADPVARITGSCTGLSCPLSGATSTDSDGSITSYAWDFGDGTQASGVDPGHTYAAAGTYTVTLTVTDDDLATDTATQQVTVSDAPPPAIAFRAVASADANTSTPSVQVPASVQAGDRLVLFVSNNTGATMTTPAGWTQVSTALDGTDLRSYVLTRTAVTGTAGSSVQVTLSAASKASMILAAYSGAGSVSAFASALEAGTSPTSHTAPSVSVPVAGSTLLRYWVDKSSTQHSWTLPAPLTERADISGSPSGNLTAALGDVGGVAAGATGTAAATTTVGSGKAIAWSIVLGPA